MSGSTWYYMSKGWFRKTHRVGPISERELLECIDKGKIQPSTMVQSEKTRNKWVPMNRIGPAIRHYRRSHPDEAKGNASAVQTQPAESQHPAAPKSAGAVKTTSPADETVTEN